MNHAQRQGDPNKLGLEPQRLAAISEAMKQFVDSKKLPHVSTLIAKSGKIIQLESQGLDAHERDSNRGIQTLHRLYSNSKPIAGVATLIMCERGHLSLDDPVAKFLPEWNDLLVVNFAAPMFPISSNRELTIRDLLANTTGLLTPNQIPEFVRAEHEETLRNVGLLNTHNHSQTEILPLRERVREYAKLPLMSHPGERFVYHVGYPLLDAVLSELNGGNLEQFLRAEIFEPLNMLDTSICVDASKLGRISNLYVVDSRQGNPKITLVENEQHVNRFKQPRPDFDIGGAGGGIVSTITDYARFAQMLANGGELDGVRILGRKTMKLLVADHTNRMQNPLTGPGFHWGLGVSVYHGQGSLPRLRSVGTFGWGGAAGTQCFIDPQEQLIGVLFTQLLGHDKIPDNNFRDTFERLTYQALV